MVLEPPISLESQRRIWGLAQRIASHPDVREAIPGMNNLTVLQTHPQLTALDAIERLQRWWEESESVLPEARQIAIPVIYGGDAGPRPGAGSGMPRRRLTLRVAPSCVCRFPPDRSVSVAGRPASIP